MTDQEAFDRVYRHLLTQRKKSQEPPVVGSTASCLYRGPGGLMCAVGCLIPDSQYHSWFEGLDVSSIHVHALDGVSAELLASLQSIHDDQKPSRWGGKLRSLARELGLTVPELSDA